MAKQNKPIITKHFIPTESNEVEILLSISNKAIQSGLIKRVGQRGFSVLVVLASYMNKNHVSFPSQGKIAELVGMSRPTVTKAINELVELGVVSMIEDGRHKHYQVNFTALKTLHVKEELDAETDKDIIPEIVFTNSKDVANYFADKYKEVYGSAYTINYGRDLSLIKNKILNNYSDVDIKRAIDIAIENYENQWANANYLRPTIPMLATWLINDALAWDSKQQKDQDELAQRIKDAEADDMTDIALELF